jgi:hypothetical protein
MNHDDDELRISAEDACFVRKLDALYRPPVPTAAERARFVARLEERIARGRGRRPWLLGGAAATLAAASAALVLALLPQREPSLPPTSADVYAAAEEPASAEEALLLLANGPLEDPDEALPEDYQMLASLLE